MLDMSGCYPAPISTISEPKTTKEDGGSSFFE